MVEPRDETDRKNAFQHLRPTVQTPGARLNLKTGFDALHRIVIDHFSGIPDAQVFDHVRALEHTFSDAFIATLIVVDDEPFALSVFGGLNARGVPLGAADQIKNELFTRTDADSHHRIKADWDAIVDHVPGGNIEHFLRQRYLAFVKDECPKSQLYSLVRDNELSKNDPEDVIAEWRRDAELLSILTTMRGDNRIKGNLERQLQNLYRTLHISFSWPLLLSAGRRYFPQDIDTFGKLARLTLAFCFRVLTIGKADVLDLERTIARAAIALTNGVSPTAIARMLRDANSDEEFKEKFEAVALTRAAVQFYVLYEIEAYRSRRSGLGLEPLPHSPQQNVEHILPKSLPKQEARLGEWAEWRTASKEKSVAHGEYVNRLGNLLILEAEINNQVKNYNFQAKQTGSYPGGAVNVTGSARLCFGDSKLNLAAEACDRSKYAKWGMAEIERRQAVLARDALRVWTLELR